MFNKDCAGVIAMGARCAACTKDAGDISITEIISPRELSKSNNAGYSQGIYLQDDPDRPKLVLVSDPGQDLDDEMAYIMLRHLVEQGMVDVQGIIATLNPAFDRARLAKGTLATLGLHTVPIGLGTEGGDVEGVHKASTFENWAKPYMPPRHSSVFEPGRGLLHRLYEQAAPKSLSLVIIASLKDPALFLRDKEALFVAKTREVIIMGGVEHFDEDCIVLKPDTAHNHTFDWSASEFFYQRCQHLGVPLIVVSRWAAYAAMVPRSCYDELAALGSWVGCRLRNAQRASIENLWNRVCGTGDEREGLPERCNRAWFLKTFCGGDSAKGRHRGDTIWDLVEGFMQYDSVATLAAVPALRRRFFSPTLVNGKHGATHMVIGCTEQKHSLSNPAGLGEFLRNGFVNGLSLNNRRRVQFILISHPKWNNLVHELLACTVLRTLFDLGIFDCVGIIISPGPSTAIVASGTAINPPLQEVPTVDEDSIEEQAKEIMNMLKLLGLAHVPVDVAEAYTSRPGKMSGSDLLAALYKKVSPAGVSLVINGALGEAAEFAEKNPTEFQQKTRCVIHMGGAFPSALKGTDGKPTGDTTIVPDDAAQNNNADMPAANKFYKMAMELLVPLTIISRHCAGAVQVPRALFDNLARDGGAIGKKLKKVQQSCIMKLWTACSMPSSQGRRGLPSRCDTEWFIETFCDGIRPNAEKGEDGVWEAVRALNCYTLLAVLMALPPFVNKYIRGTPTTVRSVTHTIIGLTKGNHGVIDDNAMRECIFQCLFSGTYLNDSRFDYETGSSPQVPMTNGQIWKCQDPRDALDWMLPRPPGADDFW